jgi:hypothetical protein
MPDCATAAYTTTDAQKSKSFAPLLRNGTHGPLTTTVFLGFARWHG